MFSVSFTWKIVSCIAHDILLMNVLYVCLCMCVCVCPEQGGSDVRELLYLLYQGTPKVSFLWDEVLINFF